MSDWKDSRFVMPRANERVLISLHDGEVTMGYWIDIKRKWMVMGLEKINYIDKGLVHAWQPIPECYRGK